MNNLKILTLFFWFVPFPTLATSIGISFYNFNNEEEVGLSNSDSISLLSLAASLLAILFSIYQYNKSKKISIKEQFWLRAVILPGFIQELTSFFDNAVKSKKSHESPLDFYINIGIPALNALQDRAYLLGVGCKGLDKIIQNEIECFQDEIMHNINSSDEFIKNVTELSTKIVGSIQEKQIAI